jgi:hypothetical protein
MRVASMRKRDRLARMYALLAITPIPIAVLGAAWSPPGLGSWILPAAALVGCALCIARALRLHHSGFQDHARASAPTRGPKRGVECCSPE